jgi:hypothetical protein
VSDPQLPRCSAPRDTRICKVERHSFRKLRLVLRLLGPATGSRERLTMSEKLPLILAIGAAGKFSGMVVPELTKRGASALTTNVREIHVGRVTAPKGPPRLKI